MFKKVVFLHLCPRVPPWYPRGTPVVPLGYPSGDSLEPLWYAPGTPVIPPWYLCGTPVGPLRYPPGTLVVPPWTKSCLTEKTKIINLNFFLENLKAACLSFDWVPKLLQKFVKPRNKNLFNAVRILSVQMLARPP